MRPTRERLIDAALALFPANGYAATSIAKLEREAGLAPRAGGFYRHFPSKEALAVAAARERVLEREEEFDIARLLPLGDTKSELLLIGKAYLESSKRQAIFQPVLAELRTIPALRRAESEANRRQFSLLCNWLTDKLPEKRAKAIDLPALAMTIFGGPLFMATKMREGVEIEALPIESYLEAWACQARDLIEGRD